MSDHDKQAVIFIARLEHVIAEFEGKVLTSTAIGCLELLKAELIADALEDEDD